VRGAAALELQLPRPDQGLAPGAFVALAQRAQVPLGRLAVGCGGEPLPGVGQGQHRRKPARPIDHGGAVGAAGRTMVELVGVVGAAVGADAVAAVEACVVEVGEPGDEAGPGLRAPGVDRAAGRKFGHVLAVAHVGDVHVHRGAVSAHRALVGTFGAGVVAGPYPDDTGAHDDLPAGTLTEYRVPAGGLLDRGQQVGRSVHQLRRGKRRPPQFTDVRRSVFVDVPDRYGRWDKPYAAGRRRPGPVVLAGWTCGLPWAPAFGAPRAAWANRPQPVRCGAASSSDAQRADLRAHHEHDRRASLRWDSADHPCASSHTDR
jgi:hypothetical protein